MLGPTGVGKSFVACALAQKACRDGYSAFYTRAVALFRDLAMARADGSLRNLLARLSRIDVLVIDDWAMAPLAEPERRDFWEICEDRYQIRSLILTSQLPVARWHEQSAIPPPLTASSTGWFTTLTASRCAAIRCARIAESRSNPQLAQHRRRLSFIDSVQDAKLRSKRLSHFDLESKFPPSYNFGRSYIRRPSIAAADSSEEQIGASEWASRSRWLVTAARERLLQGKRRVDRLRSMAFSRLQICSRTL